MFDYKKYVGLCCIMSLSLGSGGVNAATSTKENISQIEVEPKSEVETQKKVPDATPVNVSTDLPPTESSDKGKSNKKLIWGGVGAVLVLGAAAALAGGGGSSSSGSSGGYSTSMLSGCWAMTVQNKGAWATYCFNSSGKITSITSNYGYPTVQASGTWRVSSSGAITGDLTYIANHPTNGISQWWRGSISGTMTSTKTWVVPLNSAATMRGTKK